MAFNEGDDGIPVPPISLRANLLDGGLAADQVTPTTSVMGYRLKLVGSSHLCRVHNGLWYAPLAARTKDAADTAARAAAGSLTPSSANNWAKASTVRRRQNRAIANAQQKAAAVAARRGQQVSDGEISDDSTAELRSAVARARVAASGAGVSGAGVSGVRFADQGADGNLC